MVRLQPSSGRFDLLKPAEHGAGFVGVRPVQDESGRVWVGSLHGLIYVDGDRLRAQAQLLERQAYQDALTGLPNRRAFEERIGEELRNLYAGQGALSLAMMDIDHFKRINDQRSHAIGDEVLRRFAQVVGRACRSDDFLARIGGEEFVLLLPRLEQDEALAACERVRAAVEHSDLGQVAQGLPVTTSIGVMQAVAGTSPDALMQAADAALYRAKHGGRNRVEGAARPA